VRLAAQLDEDFKGLPGEALVRRGLEDFTSGTETVGAFLVQIGAPRLRLLDIPLPENIDHDADGKLYFLLGREFGNEAHSTYNSYIRELVSFKRALERRVNEQKTS